MSAAGAHGGGRVAAARRAPRRCRSGSLPWPPGPSGSPSCRGCWAPSTRCARPGWARSSTTWPARGVAADDVAAEVELVWWTSLRGDLTRARPGLRRPRRRRTCAAIARGVHRRRPRPPARHRTSGCARPPVAACARSWPTTPTQEALVRAEARQVPPPPAACATCCRGAGETLTAIKPVLGDEPAGGRLGAAAGPLVRRGHLRRGLADPARAGHLGDLAGPPGRRRR